MEGGTTPTSFPHRCPYQRFGASKNFCEETTASYQRNLAGCCGTNDSRAFAPCNSQWRKCVKCLSEGRGSKSNKVEDVARGLCEEHAEGAQTSAVSRPRQSTPAPKPVPKVVVAILTQPKIRVAASATETETRLEVMRNISKNMQPASPKPCPVPPVVYVPPKRPEMSKPAWKPALKPVVVAPVQNSAQLPVKKELVVLPILPDIELADLARRIDKLTHRRKVVLAEMYEKGHASAAEALGLSEGSVKVYLSKILTDLTLGYPSNSPFIKLTSREKKACLFRAWELHHKESFEKNPPGLVRQPRKVDKKRGIFLKEHEMLKLFRQMGPEEQDRYLKIGADLLSKSKL